MLVQSRTPAYLSRLPAPGAKRAQKRGETRSAPIEKTGQAARAPDQLRQAIRASYLTPVHDGELKDGVQALLFHHNVTGYFEGRTAGMRAEDLGDVEVMLTPNRMKNRGPKPCGCPFCQSPAPAETKERGLSWRDWRVLPNKFPYAKDHLVLSTEGHVDQGFRTGDLANMLDFQRAMGGDVSMHFNGKAGNSQSHLHWHAERETFAVERWLDAGELDTTSLRRSPDGTLSTFDRAGTPHAGFLVEGSDAFVTRWAGRVLEKLEKDPDHEYNVIVLKPKDGRARVVVGARTKESAKVEAAGVVAGMGAMGVVGRPVVWEDGVPEGFAEEYLRKAARCVARPSDFPWIDELRAMPSSSWLAARLS
jgi:hypothetical protein